MKFEKFDGSSIKDLRQMVEEALDVLNINHGIRISAGDISYSGLKANIKVEALIIGDADVNDDEAKYKVEYINNLKLHLKFARQGLAESHFGKEFQFRGHTFLFYGVIPKGRKNLYKGKDLANGEVYKLPADAITSILS